MTRLRCIRKNFFVTKLFCTMQIEIFAIILKKNLVFFRFLCYHGIDEIKWDSVIFDPNLF